MPSPTNKAPVLVLSLIFAMLCLTIGAIALIVLFNANRPDSATIAAACKNEVGAAIKTESDRVTAACEEAAIIPPKKASAGYIMFNYPANWSVVMTTKENDGAIETTYASPEAIDLSVAMIQNLPIVMQVFTKNTPEMTKAGSLKAFVQARVTQDADPSLTASVVDSTINGQKVIVANFTVPGGPSAGAYRDIYFDGQTTYAVAQFHSPKELGSNGGMIAWDELFGNNPIEQSLDFSLVQ